ncbi:flippase [Turicibacter sanguinis]|uniref:flippase n=1 Tax=Turicibacter sanguinis TaxID=154288 RepID=UPI001899983E|nr:flippase [Turicibacter sanguinis]
MKDKNVKGNYIYNLIYQLLVMFIPLLTTPYLSRVLGSENIGIYSYTLSITTYFILFGSLGVSMYGQREIAYNQDNKYQVSKMFKEIFYLRLITLLTSMMIFYVVFCMQGEYKIYYLIFLLEIIATIFDISWFFQGLEEFKKTVIRNILVKLISLICIFTFVKNNMDLDKYILIYVLSILFGNLSLWIYIPKYIVKVRFKDLNIFKHFRPTIAIFIPQIAIQIYTVLDKTMIGAIIIDKSEVGYYEQAQKIIKLLMAIATSLGTVMMPRIANTFAKGDFKKLTEYMNNSFSFITLLTFPLMFGIMSVSYKFVPLFFGPDFDKVTPLMCTISPIIVFIGLSNVTGTQYLLPTNQQKKFTLSVVCGALINFFLNLILIKKFSSIGASVATVIAEFCVTTIQFYLIRNEIKIITIIKLSYKYFISSIIMFIVSVFVGNYINNYLLSIIIQVICSGIIYFIVLIILKDKYLMQNLKILK